MDTGSSLERSAEDAVLRRQVPLALLHLALPIIAVWVSRTLMSFADFTMVSWIPDQGTEAQAAITPANLFLFCFIGLGMGTVTSVQTFVSQCHGAGRAQDAASFAWQGLYLAMIFGGVFAPIWWLTPVFFAWVGHEPQVQAMEVAYARIGVVGIAPAIAMHVLSNFFNGIYRPGITLVAVLVANVANVLANYALIFGHWGAPALGMAGAAWATTGCTLLQALILLAWMLKSEMARRYQTRSTWGLDLRKLWKLIRIGLPAGLHFVCDILTWSLFCIVLVGQFGTAQLAANNLALRLLETSFMPAVGMGMALTTAVGKSIGHGRPDLARLNVRWAGALILGYMTTVGLILLIFREPLAGLWTSDLQVLHWSGIILIFCGIFQVFDAMNITFVSALRGAGDTAVPAAISLTSSVLVLLLGGFLVARYMPQWGSAGPWLMGTLNITLLGLIFGMRYRLGGWERIDLLDRRPQERSMS